MPSHKPFENNLHHIINDFMSSDYDFWLSMDADNPPINNPLDLVDLDLDIVGLPTPVWNTSGPKGDSPVYWNAFRSDDDGYAYKAFPPKDGLHEVDAIGTGCFLISRRVFENPEMRKAPFQRVWNEDGTVEFGNDLAFCKRAKAQGFKIHAHFGYHCDHINQISLQEAVRTFGEMKRG